MLKIIYKNLAVILILTYAYAYAEDTYKIGYIEGEPYWVFNKVLETTLKVLNTMGWKNRLEFPEYARFSPGEPEKKEELQRNARKLMSFKELDLVIVAGTDATAAILPYNNKITPILSIAVSDPLKSGFVKNKNDSGIDNYSVRIEPELYDGMFYSFHAVVGFKRLGLMYCDHENSRMYSNVDVARKIAAERGFELVEYNQLSTAESSQECLEGLQWLLDQKIDAFFISAIACFDWAVSDVRQLLEILNQHKIPTLARQSSMYVKAGALMGFASGFSGQANFIAYNINKILKGASPRSLQMIDFEPPKFSFNIVVAEKIGYEPAFDFLIICDEIYDYIQLPEDRLVK